jgi:hypothetical protein
MQIWQPFPSGIPSNGLNSGEQYLDGAKVVGLPDDPIATNLAESNSMFSIAKGIADQLGVPTGSGEAVVDDNPKNLIDLTVTLGDPTDPAATGDAAGSWSAISLLKGILAQAGI